MNEEQRQEIQEVMIDVDTILNSRISYQDCVWSLPSAEPSIYDVLGDIRTGRYAEQIDYLRILFSRGNSEQYSIDKKKLPGVTFSGTFSTSRRVQELKEYNDILVIDIDHLDSEQLSDIRNVLRVDTQVLACWVSPSGQGLKGLVYLSYSNELEELDIETRHRTAFVLVADYFKEEHSISLDQSGSDVTRLCFVSNDPALHIRTSVRPFSITAVPESLKSHSHSSSNPMQKTISIGSDSCRRHLLHRTEGKNEPNCRATMQSIIKYLEKRQLSITDGFDQWVRVALAIADTFTYNVGKRYFLRLCRLDGDSHDEDGSIRLLELCYYTSRGLITFGTIRHYARKHGYG